MKIKNQLTIKRALFENTVKHVLVFLISIILVQIIQNEILQIKLKSLSEFLSLISILLVTACFANFASSYEITDISKNWMRILSQTASFIFLLLIATLLETLVLAIQAVYPGLFSLTLLFSVFLYAGIVLYDYWDFMRVFARRNENTSDPYQNTNRSKL